MLPKKSKLELLQEKYENETNEYRKKQLEAKILLLKNKKMLHNSLLDGTYYAPKVVNK